MLGESGRGLHRRSLFCFWLLFILPDDGTDQALDALCWPRQCHEKL